MSRVHLSRSFFVSSSFLIGCSLALSALAATGDTISSSSASSGSSASSPSSGGATLLVEQVTVNRMFGTWHLLGQNGTAREGALESETASELPPGNYTFLVDPPEGAVSTLRLYSGTELRKSLERTQMNFAMQEGDALRMVIHHVFNRVGTVIVETDPVGVSFKLSGPNNQRYEGVTPASYLHVPEGQYKVEFGALPGCVQPAPKSLLLVKDSRVSFTLKIVCEAAERMREEQRPLEEERFVTVEIGTERIVFKDVPQAAWFAPYVFDTVRRGVLSGYRDTEGHPTGRFGPENNVTVAELAKIAHTLAGLDPAEFSGVPDNPEARGTWFEAYIRSAEARGWTIFEDATVHPLRDATRGEVLVTLLQVLDVPLRWQKGSVFTDVTRRTPFAAAIETAHGIKLVEGRMDIAGQDTGLFGPTDPINRAELSKIVDKAIELKLASK